MLSGSPDVKPNIAPWSRVTRLTPATMALAVMAGPEGNFIGSCCPVARIFMLVPPISITSTFIIEVSSNLASFHENNRARDTGDNRSHQNTHLCCLERGCLVEGEIGDEQRHGKSDATQHSNSNNLTPAKTIQHRSQT